MVIKSKISKKLLAILLTIVLVMSTVPVGLVSVFAAIKSTFTVEIEDYSYSADVTLTNTTNHDSRTVTATNGKADFVDFAKNALGSENCVELITDDSEFEFL